MWDFHIWQRVKDSNPHKRSQSPVCYHYTNPLCRSAPKRMFNYMQIFEKVKGKLLFF